MMTIVNIYNGANNTRNIGSKLFSLFNPTSLWKHKGVSIFEGEELPMHGKCDLRNLLSTIAIDDSNVVNITLINGSVMVIDLICLNGQKGQFVCTMC